MQCVRLADVFERLGIRHLDFLSLDVEGSDESALKGIDFKRVTIDFILCEEARDCTATLVPLGYEMRKLQISSQDVVFIRRDVLKHHASR